VYKFLQFSTSFEINRNINSKRQPRNLKRFLTFSKYETKISKCKTPRCGSYNINFEGGSFIFKKGFHFDVRQNMNDYKFCCR